MLKRFSMLLAVAIMAVAAPLAAQDKFPSRPITMIIPTPPGGGVDTIHRMLAEFAEPVLGVSFVIENKPGAGGSIGVSTMVTAKPDGYTIAAVWNAPVTIVPHSLKVPYSIADITPVIQSTGGTPLIFCVRPDFPAGNGKEFVSHVKQNPGKYTYGTDGVGAIIQLSGERLFQPLGLKLRPVPFGGASETLKNFLGGHIDIYGGSIPPILGQMQAGKAKCLLATTASRPSTMPDSASAGDLGLAERATELWRGLIAPKGTPADRVKTLADAFRKAAQAPKFQAYVKKRNERAVAGTPAEFAAVIKAENKAFADVVMSIGLTKK